MVVQRSSDRIADEYGRRLAELAAQEPLPVGAFVTRGDVYDLLILYESLVASWSVFPFELHAFVVEDEVADALACLEIDNLRVHRLPGGPADWTPLERAQAALVEHAGLERCLVSDVTNVFLEETPELLLLLAEHDLVFVGAAAPDRVATHLWSFRRSERAIGFAREWRAQERESAANGSGLRSALEAAGGTGARIKVLAGPAPDADHWPDSPYAVQPVADRLRIARPVDAGAEETMATRTKVARPKVVHLGRLRGRATDSAADRVIALIDLYPAAVRLVAFYSTIADRAARRIGAEGLDDPLKFGRVRLVKAGVIGSRKQFPRLLNGRRLRGTAVEVGVKAGRFSEQILEAWKGARLISVDPWMAAPSGEYVDAANVDQERHDAFYEETRERLRRFGDRSEIWRMTSEDAAARVDPHSLDFVYIDARHDYQSVKEDLELWFDKVRPGGILAGHDYLDADLPSGHYRVKSAVDEFFAARGLSVKSTFAGEQFPSWFVEIPDQRGRSVA